MAASLRETHADQVAAITWNCVCGQIEIHKVICPNCNGHKNYKELLDFNAEAGVKFDEAKLSGFMHLDCFADQDFLAEMGKVLQYGATKYSPRNWEKGMAWSRCYDAARRHLGAWAAGEAVDPETGLHHMAHAACCLMFLFHYDSKAEVVGVDDRITQ